MSTKYLQLSKWLTMQAEVLIRGGILPWWNPTIQPTNEMYYTCEPLLGSPATADCNHLQYNFDNSMKNMKLTAGEVRFLSSSRFL